MSEVKALVPTNGNGGNGNGHGQLPALSDVVVTAWTPSARDLKYVQAVVELLNVDGKLLDSSIGARLGVTKQAVQKMEKRPGFMDWVNSEIRRLTDNLWPKAVHRCAVLATRGSIDHFNALAKLRGDIRESPPPGQAIQNNGLMVVIHE